LRDDDDSDSEIEDLMNPKDELKKKIVNLAGTMRKWNDETTKVRKTVREQFADILNIGLNKYKMQKTELRDLITTIFRFHGISDSWMRKLLPMELKDSSKIPISHLQRKEIEKERQRLLQQQNLESKHESERAYSLPDSSTVESVTYQPAEPELTTSSPEDRPRLETCEVLSSFEEENQQIDIYKRIKSLEAKVLRLSEPFVARANLQALSEEVHVVANIDPVEKAIKWIRFDNDTGI
jgi:hypothetical protein